MKEGFLHFTLGNGKSIILDAKSCREVCVNVSHVTHAWYQTSEEILRTYAIPTAFSEDLTKPVEAIEGEEELSAAEDDDDDSSDSSDEEQKQEKMEVDSKAKASRGKRKAPASSSRKKRKVKNK